MKMNKKIIGLALATTFLLTTVVGCTTDKSDVKNKNADVEVIEEPTPAVDGDDKADDTDKDKTETEDKTAVPVEGSSKYVDYKGTVSEVTNEDNLTQATVDGEGDGIEFKNIKFNITDETVLVSDKTKDLIEADKIKEGDNVEVFYDKDAPMTKSIPPMTNAKAIVLREAEEEQLGVKVTKFNDELISEDNSLQLKITDDTTIVDQNGKDMTKEDMIGKEVVAFYGPAVTMSLPGQSNAVKIIVLSNSDSAEKTDDKKSMDIKIDDKIIVNDREIVLADKMYKSEGIWMMPIRDVGVALGYDVKWDNPTRMAELKKNEQMLTSNADANDYGINKETVKLEKAPEIKEARMYVPVSFIEEVMKLDTEVTEDGTIIVKL